VEVIFVFPFLMISSYILFIIINLLLPDGEMLMVRYL
jgi:hypothetical protein